jgi:signal transduction histidine kinase
VTTAVLPLAPVRKLRKAPLLPIDGSLAQLAHGTCESVAQLADLSDAVLGVMSTATDEVQVLACWGGARLEQYVTHGPVARLLREAAVSMAFATSPDKALLASVAPAGKLLVVLLGRRADGIRIGGGDLRPIFESITRVTALSLCDRMRLMERERRLQVQQQAKLACALHEEVVQRLFGVSLILDADEALAADLRAVCSTEVERALADLRMIISSPIDPEAATSEISDVDLRTMLELLSKQGTEVDAEFDELSVSAAQQAIAHSILNEALRNARKHAEPNCVRITVRQTSEVLLVSVFNDGVRVEGRGRRSQRGVGLQLAATEAALGGGVLERGPVGRDGWTVRLTLPLEERDDYRNYAGAYATGASGG